MCGEGSSSAGLTTTARVFWLAGTYPLAVQGDIWPGENASSILLVVQQYGGNGEKEVSVETGPGQQESAAVR